MNAPFRVDVLGTEHDRASFTCGVEALDSYFSRQATQDVRRRASACFVAIDVKGGGVAGCYTLSAGGVALTDLPSSLSKRLPRYPSVPVARIGRLAIATQYQGQKLGAALLADAAVRAMRSEVAVFALVVDAKDEKAESFYRHHGFKHLPSAALKMFAPLERFKIDAY